MRKKTGQVYEHTSSSRGIKSCITYVWRVKFLTFENIYNKDCPKECDYTDFKTSISTADYPTDYYAKMLRAQSKIRDRFSNQFEFTPYDGTETTTASGTTATSPTSDQVTVKMIEASMAKIKLENSLFAYSLEI